MDQILEAGDKMYQKVVSMTTHKIAISSDGYLEDNQVFHGMTEFEFEGRRFKVAKKQGKLMKIFI
jgi:hypothetical protein